MKIQKLYAPAIRQFTLKRSRPMARSDQARLENMSVAVFFLSKFENLENRAIISNQSKEYCPWNSTAKRFFWH